MGLGTAGILWGCAVQVYFAVNHCKDTLWFGAASIVCGWGTARIPCGWALQGYYEVGHCRVRSGSVALRGYVWHCRDIPQLGTAEDTLRVGHCKDAVVRRGGGRMALRRNSAFEHCCDTLANARAAILLGPLWAFHLKGATKSPVT